MIKSKAVGIAALVFAALLALSALLVGVYANDKRDASVENASYLIDSQVSDLDRALSSYLQAANTLRILVVDGQGVINDFDTVARELYNDDDAFRSIQLAPDGVVQYVYPLEGNEEAFGDLFADPDRRTEAEYARDTGETTLAGPFELYQAGMGIVVRQPIYLGEGDAREFWGFAIVVLNVPEIFGSVHLGSLDALGYDYQLWRIHPDTGEKQVILSEGGDVPSSALERSFDVPGSTWTLSLYRPGGWVGVSDLLPVIVVAVSIALLIALLCFALLTINGQRKEMAEMSYRDHLTGLYNARKLSDVLSSLHEEGAAFCFAYLDVDDFKQVNDTYGHAAGDVLLKTVALRMLASLSLDNLAFRIGGDEFALVVVDADCMEELAATLKSRLSAEVVLEDGVSYFPDVSIGYACCPHDASDIDLLMRMADEKMYRMKRSADGTA